MKSTKAVAVCAALFLAVTFAAVAGGQQEGGSGEEQLTGSFTVAGSSTVLPISSAMAEEFS